LIKTIIIIFLLLPTITFAQERHQWNRTLQNQQKAKYYYFKLPHLDDELEENFKTLSSGKGLRHYYRGIRFSIRPSFEEQVTYEFFYNYYEDFESYDLEVKNRISEASDLDYILFRKYKISEETKKIIEKRYYSSEAAPDQLIIAVTDFYAKSYHSNLIQFENRILSYFKNPPHNDSTPGVTDGVTYTFEVCGFVGYCKFSIHAPNHNSVAMKLIKDMQNMINSLESTDAK
jgi:hypothetical protein